MTAPEPNSTQSGPEANPEPTDVTGTTPLDVRGAAKPAATVLLVGFLILLVSAYVTARREGAQLQSTLESAKELCRACLRFQQSFDLQVKGITGVLQELQAAEALSERRKLWTNGLAGCLEALPTGVRLASLTIGHTEQSAPERTREALLFGEDFGVRPPLPCPPLSVQMTCELAPDRDPGPQMKEIKRRFEELPGVAHFAFLDSTRSAEVTGPARPSVSFELTMELTGRAAP